MAKRLNKNLVITLAALGFLVTTAAGVLMVRQLRQTNPEEFAKRAEEAAGTQDWERAVTFYRRAYQVSGDPTYLVRAGDMDARRGKELQAIRAYQTATEVKPELLEAQEKLLDLRLEIALMQPRSQEYWQDVVRTAEAIFKIPNQEKHPRALHATGMALLGLRQQDAANEAKGVEYLEKAVQEAPDDVDFASRLASYYNRAANRSADAEKLYRALVERNTTPGKNAARARCAYAGFLTEQANAANAKGDKDQAEKLYDQARKNYEEAQTLMGDDPEVQSSVLVDTARWWSGRWEQKRQEQGAEQAEEEFAKAVDALERAASIYPEGFEAYQTLVVLYRAKGDAEKGIAKGQERLKRGIQREGLKAFINRAQRYQLQLTVAESYIEMANKHPEGSDDRLKLAKEADLAIEDALGEIQDGPEAIYLRGRVRLAEGKDREAVQAFEKADQLSPVPNPANLFFLAQMRLRERQLGAAREAITKALSVPGADIGVWLLYSQILLQSNEAKEALQAVNQVLAVAPDNTQAQLIKAAAQEQLGQTVSAEAISGDTPVLVAAQAQRMAQAGRTDEAIQRITEGLAKNPTDPTLVRAAAAIYKSAQREADARRVIETARTQAPDNFDLKVLALANENRSPEEYRKAYLALIEEEKDEYLRAMRRAAYYSEDNDRTRQYEQMAIAKDLIVKRATEAARAAGEGALRKIVDLMFNLAAEARDEAKLDALVKEATDLNLDAADGQSYRGRRLLFAGRRAWRDGRKDEARKYYQETIEVLKRALDSYPTNGQALAEMGEAYLLLERYNESVDAFQRSDNLAPGNGTVNLRLAQLAQNAGNEAEFQARLSQCEKLIPDDPWVAEQLLARGEDNDPRSGIERREKIREKSPDDVGNLLRLAELYRKVGDLTAAGQRVDEALKARSDTATLTSAAAFLRSIGQADRALKTLQENVRQAPTEQKPQAQLLVATHFEALGQYPAAEAAYLAAADLQASREVCIAIARFYYGTGRFESSLEWLEKARGAGEKEGTPTVDSVQRMYIETLLRLRRVTDARKACDQYVADHPNDPAGLYLDAEVLSRSGDIEGAIRKLTLFLEANPRHAVARYRRAEYFRDRWQWQRCIADLEELRAIDPNALDFAPRILLAQAYVKAGQPDLALQDLQNVLRDRPDAGAVVDELVRQYRDQKRYAEADSLITSLLSKAPEKIAWLVLAGDIALDRNDRGKALSNLEQAAAKSGFAPDVVEKLLAAYERLGAVDQGISYFEDKIPPDRRVPSVLLAYANLLAAKGNLPAALDAYRTAMYRSGYKSLEFYYSVIDGVGRHLGLAKALEAFGDKPADELLARVNQLLLAGLLHSSGEYDKALDLCNTLLKDSDNPAEKVLLLLLSGEALAGKNNFPEAKATYEQVLTLDDENLMALNNLAYLLTDRLHQPQAAVPYAERAAQLSDTAAVLDTLGWAYVEVGRYGEAIGQLTLAIRRGTSFVAGYYHLAEAYRRGGQFEDAITNYQQVLNQPRPSPAPEGAGEGENVWSKAEKGLQKAQARSSD